MKKFFLLLLFVVILFPQILLSQKSIHQLDYEAHKYLKKEAPLPDVAAIKIMPLVNSKKNLTHYIYGYLPDWEYQSARSNLKYDLLTHISAFDFVVSSDGTISAPSYWPWSDVINAAHANGVKVIMTAVDFTASSIHNILTDANAKQRFIDQTIAIIKAYQLDGVNVDFEGTLTADRGSLLNNFMSNLSDAVHSALPGKEVSFAGPAVNWGGWDLLGLANACDYIFIMGYDFYGSWSTKTGASSPLDVNSGTSISIRNTVEIQYAEVTNTKPQKLILGVPYYGQKWKTADSLPHSTVSAYVSSTRFSSDGANVQVYGKQWANDTKTPWYRYKSGNDWYQVWFDNDSSLGLKYQLAVSKGFKGVGMWALNYDGARLEYWNELRKRFYYEPNSIENNTEMPNDFQLHQNYPNPFNPSTNILYSIPKSEIISLKIYDILGKEISTLVNERKEQGNYNVVLDMNKYNLASGVYYYTFRAGKYFNVKKMMYLR